MQTSMRVDAATRDAIGKIAAEELGGVSMDEALRVLVFEHRTRTAFARLEADPEAMAAYREQARQLAEVDVEVAD